MSFVKRDNLGEDVIEVNREHAKQIQWSFLHAWRPRKDVMILIYGPGILTALTAYSGYCFTTFYRRKLNLKTLGHFATYMPTVFMPGALAPLFHRLFVSSNIIVDPQCIVCDQVKAAAFQNIVGTIQPLFLAPVAAYMVANNNNTARLPSLWPDWRGLLKYHMKLSKSLYSQTLPLLFALNTFIPMILTYLEYKNIFRFAEKMKKIEELGDRLLLQEVPQTS